MSKDSYTSFLEKAKTWVSQEFEAEEQIISTYLKPHKKEDYSIPAQKKVSSPIEIPFLNEIESTEILLISSNKVEEEIALLRRMASAIDKRIAKAFLVELPLKREEGWFEQLFLNAKKTRWVLISELELYLMPDLMLLYQKKPKRTLSNIPLFLLADLKAYNEDAELKKSLWTTLLNQL